jgi:hypothetical protein
MFFEGVLEGVFEWPGDSQENLILIKTKKHSLECPENRKIMISSDLKSIFPI